MPTPLLTHQIVNLLDEQIIEVGIKDDMLMALVPGCNGFIILPKTDRLRVTVAGVEPKNAVAVIASYRIVT